MKNDYQTIRAWGHMLGSFFYFIEDRIKKAKETNAPEDALFQRDDGTWCRLSDVTNENTKRYFREHHPELAEKFLKKEKRDQ